MDPYAAQFWEFTKVRELRLQQCEACRKFRWPPSPTCDSCLAEAFYWATVSGVGKVISWVTFRRQYFSEYPSGHTVATLELKEGPLFVTVPRGVAEQELTDGLELTLDWEASVDRFGEYNLPIFRPRASP